MLREWHVSLSASEGHELFSFNYDSNVIIQNIVSAEGLLWILTALETHTVAPEGSEMAALSYRARTHIL